MNYKDFMNDLQTNNIHNFYIFYGNEKYLIDNALNEVKKILKPFSINFNMFVFNEPIFNDIFNSIRTISFMDKRKIIILKSDDFFDKDYWSVNEYEQFVNELKINKECIIIIVSNNIDKRKSSFKKISKFAKVIEFKKLDEINFYKDGIYKLIYNEFKLNNSNISLDVFKLFMNRVGYFNELKDINLYNVINEVKILTQKYRKITDLEIKKEYKEDLRVNIFQFCEAVFYKNENAFNLYYFLIENDEDPFKIFAMLSRQLKIIMDINYLIYKSYSLGDIQKMLNLNYYVVKNSYKIALIYDITELLNILDYFILIDDQMKYGAKNSENMVLNLISSIIFSKKNH